MTVRRVGGRRVGPDTLGLVAVGAVAIGIGAGLIIASAVGVTSWDVLTTAVADLGGMSVGVAGALLSIAVYVGCAPFGRLPGWGNLVLLFGVSAAVDGTLAVVGEPDALAWQLVLFTIGVPVVCLGVALVVVADIGVGPLEMVMLVATDRGVPLVRARVVIEVTTLAVGTVLGGDLGVGTAVFAVAAGPLIAGWLRVLGSGGARVEELEPGAGQVAQDHERAEHDDAGDHEPPRRLEGRNVPPEQRGDGEERAVGVQRQQERQQQVVVERADDVAVQQVVRAAQAAARGAVEPEDRAAGAGRVDTGARPRVDEADVGDDATGGGEGGDPPEA